MMIKIVKIYKRFTVNILMKISCIGVYISVALFLQGCAPQLGGNDYNAGEVGAITSVEYGKIDTVRIININANQKDKMGSGAVIGGAAGAALGAGIFGKGSGKLVSGALGGLLGAGAGHLAQDKMTSQQGFEYTVVLDSGKILSITQGADPAMSQGQRVKVLTPNRGRARVLPA
jgi:outer membrane lipoprotein SlyB